MFCFVLPECACEQRMKERQQNIRLDMLLFPTAHGQCAQLHWQKATGQTVRRHQPEEGGFKYLRFD